MTLYVHEELYNRLGEPRRSGPVTVGEGIGSGMEQGSQERWHRDGDKSRAVRDEWEFFKVRKSHYK